MPVDLPAPTLRGESPGEPVRAARTLEEHRPRPSLMLVGDGGLPLRVFPLGLGCCALEVLTAARLGPAAEARTAVTGCDPDAAGGDVLVVSGAVTTAMVPAVRAAYEALTEPRYVLSFGSCSATGGPFWDSYSVVPGVERVVPVDVWVPGCPPRPRALLDGLTLLAERAGAG